MNDTKILKKIYSLAKEICDKKTTFTRTDVAFELKEFGISNDSIEVSKLIYDAYIYYDNNESIKKAFLNNDLARSIVEEYQINYLLDEGNEEKAFELIQKSIGSIENLVKTMSVFLGVSDKELTSKMSEKIILSITGSRKAMNVKEKASVIFDRYTKTIDYYEEAKDSIKSLTVDFVFLRERVLELFYQYVFALVDIFGDSIKVIDPELFDFDRIEWLDTSAMKTKVKLEYDSLNKSCGKLIGEISQSFDKSIDRSVKGIRAAKSNSMGMMVAAMEMINHYASATSQTLALEEEFLTLKGNVRHDVTTIKGDLARLLEIYKTLNELYIPTAEIFFKNSKEVMSNDLKNIVNAVYDTTELKSLTKQRDKILKDVTFLDEQIKDRELNISYYTNSIEEMKSTLKVYAPDYQRAKNSKPSKPFFLFNILSLGSADKRYNRELYEWHQECKPVLNLYRKLQLDLKLNQDDLESNKFEIINDTNHYKKTMLNLKILNNKIQDTVKENPQIKAKVLPYLESYIKMLSIAKNIINSNLDTKLTKAVKIDEFEKTELPQEIQLQLSLFTDSLRKDLFFNEKMTKESIKYLERELETGISKNIARTEEERKEEEKETEKQMQHINSLQNTAIESGIVLLEAWGSYVNNKANDKLADKYYEDQYKKTEKEFIDRISVLDNKSDTLREIIKQVNTSTTLEQKRDGLLLLAKISGYSITSEDIKEMLDGTKAIKL